MAVPGVKMPGFLQALPAGDRFAERSVYSPGYAQARADFQRAARGERPKFAQWRTGIYDCGTALYSGSGYDLTVWHRLSTFDGVTNYVYAGPEIHFDRSLSPQGPASYSVASSQSIDEIAEQSDPGDHEGRGH